MFLEFFTLIPKPETKIVSIADLTPDDRNANKGTERGNYALGHSIETNGLGRSILLDKDGRIIAGNKTHAKAGELGFEEVIIIPTDGKTLVAVQRTDISLDSPEGRGLAIDDNRAGELGLEWNVEELLALHDEGLVDLSQRWTQEEIDGLMGVFEETSEDSRGSGEETNSKEIDPEGFELEHKCPKCGFEFDG